jgi:hypothetical protein
MLCRQVATKDFFDAFGAAAADAKNQALLARTLEDRARTLRA